MAEPYFDDERLEVYRTARRFNCEIALMLPDIGAGHSDSKDDLRRSAKSITRNIAEGAGRWRIRDKVHYYHIARASATRVRHVWRSLTDFAHRSREQQPG